MIKNIIKLILAWILGLILVIVGAILIWQSIFICILTGIITVGVFGGLGSLVVIILGFLLIKYSNKKFKK